MNACRFAVALDDLALNTKSKDDQKETFVTLNISFHSPITECRSGRSIITKNIDNISPADDDKYVCNSLVRDNRSPFYKREDAYRKFDQEIKSIAMSILKNNITDYNDNRTYVCCELKILSWKITDLIACDFNVRVPTETSKEFMVSWNEESSFHHILITYKIIPILPLSFIHHKQTPHI